LRPSGATISIFYVHTDQLNTPRQVTRPSDNAAMWTWNSDPFGTDAANPNPAGAGTFAYNLRFPGQLFEGQAGLHYNYRRDFDPAMGRYTESDRIGMRGGINTYAYGEAIPGSRNSDNLNCSYLVKTNGAGFNNVYVLDVRFDPATKRVVSTHIRGD
jgi:RHS repeat-associated protein